MNLGAESATVDVQIHPEAEGDGGGEEAGPSSVLFIKAVKDFLPGIRSLNGWSL